MSRNRDSRADGGRSQLQEIEELERRIKTWAFDVNDGAGSLPEVHQVEARIKEVVDEQNEAVVMAEAEQLAQIMAARRQDANRKLALLENEVHLLETEVQNKIIHKMDTEDIKYSVYRLLLTREKIEIYAEAAEAYRSVVDSLLGLLDLKQPAAFKQTYLPVKKILHSQFYNSKVKARLCYEACYAKLLQLNRDGRRQELESQIVSEYLRFKSSCSAKLL